MAMTALDILCRPDLHGAMSAAFSADVQQSRGA
jgi:hypothetical protein